MLNRILFYYIGQSKKIIVIRYKNVIFGQGIVFNQNCAYQN